MKKILFYYHHFGGLGHGTRVLSLCKAIKKHNPGYKIMVLNSGKPQPELIIDKYAKVINLPYFEAKEGLFSGLTSNDDIKITFKKRKKVLEKVADIFMPDMAIFEHFPFGRGELDEEIMHFIKNLKKRGILIYSSVRDIIEQEVDEKRLDNNLDFFNGVFVHSDKKTGFLTSFKKTTKLKDKLIFTGRIFVKSKEELIPREKIRKQLNITNKKLIVAGIGGGIDGFEILNKLIDIKDELDKKLNATILITTGNSIGVAEFKKLKTKAKNKKDILITKFNSNYLDYVNAADLSISMGGYNSINNALLTKTNTLIIPREKDNEQKLRVKTFSSFLNSFSFKELADENKFRDTIIRLLSKNDNSHSRAFEIKGDSFCKVIQNLGELTYLKLRLTNKCNCNCDMCTWIKEAAKELSLQEIKKIINDAQKLGVKTINLTGGEPTIHANFREIFQYIESRGMEVSLSTNLGFNKDILDFLIDNKIKHIDFSLDFNNSLEFDKARDKKGLFQKINYNLSNLKKLLPNLKILLNFTIRRDNFRQAPDIINFCKKYRINSVSFHLIQKTNLNLDFVKDLLLTKQDLIDFYFEVVPLIFKKADSKINIKITPFISEVDSLSIEGKILALLLLKDKWCITWLQKLYDLYNDGVKVDSMQKHSHTKLICGLNDHLRINMDGEYSPCCSMDDLNKFSNIKEKSLFNFWINRPYKEQDVPFDECFSCLNNNLLF